MTSTEAELQEMLETGRYMGAGPRYLLYYYGQLAITNDAGLMCWPKGPRVVVTVLRPDECVHGLSPARKAYLLAKLYSLEDVRKAQSRRAGEDRRRLSLQRS